MKFRRKSLNSFELISEINNDSIPETIPKNFECNS